MDIRPLRDRLVPRVFRALGVAVPRDLEKRLTYAEPEDTCRVEVTGDKVVASITEHADGTIVLKRSDRDFLTDTTILYMNGNISRQTQIIHPEHGPKGSPQYYRIANCEHEAAKLRRAAAVTFKIVQQLKPRVIAKPPTAHELLPSMQGVSVTSTGGKLKFSPGARLLFDALDVEVTSTGSGRTRFFKDKSKETILVNSDSGLATLTVYKNGQLSFLKQDLALGTSEKTSVIGNRAISGIRPITARAGAANTFRRQPISSSVETAEALRKRAGQAQVAVRMLLQPPSAAAARPAARP